MAARSVLEVSNISWGSVALIPFGTDYDGAVLSPLRRVLPDIDIDVNQPDDWRSTTSFAIDSVTIGSQASR